MFTPRLPLIASLALALYFLPFAKADDAPATYQLNLVPASKVGTKFSLITDTTDESQTDISMTMPGETAPQKKEQNQQIIAHFEGEVEVLAVFPNGSIQKLAVTVNSFIATSEGQPLPGLPGPGAKIVVEKSGVKKSCLIDDQPASANISKLIDEVIELGDDKYTDQEIFGNTSSVMVGATWPVNSTALIAELKGDSDVAMSGAKGTVKLDAVSGQGADQVATVTGIYVVEGAKPTLPAGMTVDTMNISGGLAESVPAAAKGVEKKRVTASMQMAAHGSGSGIEIKINSAGEQKKTMELTFH